MSALKRITDSAGHDAMSEKYVGPEQIERLLKVCGRRPQQRAGTGQHIEIAPPCLTPKAIDRFMALPNLENFRYIPLVDSIMANRFAIQELKSREVQCAVGLALATQLRSF